MGMIAIIADQANLLHKESRTAGQHPQRFGNLTDRGGKCAKDLSHLSLCIFICDSCK